MTERIVAALILLVLVFATIVGGINPQQVRNRYQWGVDNGTFDVLKLSHIKGGPNA